MTDSAKVVFVEFSNLQEGFLFDPQYHCKHLLYSEVPLIILAYADALCNLRGVLERISELLGGSVQLGAALLWDHGHLVACKAGLGVGLERRSGKSQAARSHL